MNCLERVLLDNGHKRFPEPPDNNMILIDMLLIYLSARVWLCRKSS